MVRLEVFDPPMCCSSGVCGPAVDPSLVRFASDLEWLRNLGVAVVRYNLTHQPEAFADNEVVREALRGDDENCLPLVLIDGRIVSRGGYPTREELASLCGVAERSEASIYSASVAELVAMGAAIACNCEPCLKFHYAAARKLGVSKDDMAMAVATAKAVKDTPAESILNLAEKLLGKSVASSSADTTAADESHNRCC